MAIKRLEDLKGAIAEQIQEFMDKNDWTQTQFADALKTNKSFVSRLLAKKYNPTLKTIVELEAVLKKKIVHIGKP